MLLFAYYLLKVSTVSALLYGYYLIALRNRKFHQYNRFYLLMTVLLSLIIPLAKIKFWNETVQHEMPAIRLLKVVAARDTIAEESLKSWFGALDFATAAFVIFSIISAALSIWLISSIIRIMMLIRSNPNKSWNNISFIFTEAKGTPFSFFRYIFWNNNIDLETEEGKLILQHELTHVQEKHSADKLFINAALIIGWLNPFFWAIRKELNMIHEFIADEKAINDGDVHSFSAMLLRTAYPQHSFTTFENSFFHSPVKRRLVMFTTSKKPSYSYLRRLMILPLLSFLIVFFVFKTKGQDVKRNNNTNKKSAAKLEKSAIANQIKKGNSTGDEEADINQKNIDFSPLLEVIADTQANSKSVDTAITNNLLAVYEAQIRSEKSDKKDNRSVPIMNYLLNKLASEKYKQKKTVSDTEVIKYLQDVIVKRITEEYKEAKEDLTKEKKSDTTNAEFPGGIQEWKRYLEKNLDANVPVTKDKAPKGDYTVKLEFAVTETGEIKDILATKTAKRCPSCAIEAVRMIRLGPKWEPMTIDGEKVAAKVIQFVTFQVAE